MNKYFHGEGRMGRNFLWVVAFITMILVGVGVAVTASNYISGVLNPGTFTYVGNSYFEPEYEISTDMEHKTDATHLYDFSGHSPSRDLLIPASQGPTAATGIYGNSYKWAFPNNRAIDVTDLGILSESFTIEAWLNPQFLSIPDPTICWAGLPDEVSLRRIFVAPNGSMLAQVTDPLLNFYSIRTLSMDSWTHVALVYDSGTGQISWIINGALDRTSEPGYASSWSGEFKIGGWTEAASYRWNGMVDEFRIIRSALSPSQIAEDMNRPIKKIVSLTGLAPNLDQAVFSVTGVGNPRRVTVDATGNADFDAFDLSGLSEGHFVVYRNDQIFQSGPLPIYVGDEYKLTYTSFLTPTIVFIVIVVAFPLGTMVAYFIKRVASKKSSAK
jgi:hypothetical protein